jgi:drug/metabolite transporter (DMT)-like permease
MSVNRAALAALMTTLVLWASAFVAIRHLGVTMSPVTISLGRQTVAAVVLGAVAFSRGFRMPAPRDWPSLVAVGVLWFAVYHVALNAAERRIDAGTASLLMQLSPILVAILASVRLGERVGRLFGVGLVVALAGVGLISVASQEASNHDVWGVLLVLVSASSYSVSVILQKPLLQRVSALDATFISAVVGAVVVLPFASGTPGDLAHASLQNLGWLVYLGLLPTALAFTTWAYALSHLPAHLMGVSTYLVPPITVVIAWVTLGETPPALVYAGGALCLAGVWLARKPARSELA